MKRQQLTNLTSLCVGILLFGACTTSNVATERGIQKRKYRKGWHSGNQIRGLSTVQEQQSMLEHQPQDTATVLFADTNDDRMVFIEREHKEIETKNEIIAINTPPITSKLSEEKPCDLVMLKNGEEINAKVTEIGTSEIKYKLCDNLEGPVYTINKKDVFKIKYANGTSTLISEIEDTQESSPKASHQKEGRMNNNNLKIMAIVGIILGGLGLFIPFLGVIGLGLGITALIFHLRKPEKERLKKVRNLSLWSIIVGGAMSLATIIIIAILY
jgi:hypothetical protein